MGVIEEYFEEHAKELSARFSRIRAAHKDADVKGGANEIVVAELLRQHIADRQIVTNSSMLDTTGQRSDEVDVAICNGYQPFLTGDQGQLLLVEGVDAVVQVKARLTTVELRRLVSNAASVKRLKRSHQQGAEVRVHHNSDVPHVVDRAVYLGFCFESALTLETATNHLRDLVGDVPSEHQPDAIYILDRGIAVNLRNNDATLRMSPPTLSGFCFERVDDVLLRLLQHLYVLRVDVKYPFHPLTRYWQFGSQPG